MDKLGQMAYEDENLLHRYKGSVALPPICMVDDILSIQRCPDSFKDNAIINAFIELKKLTLSEKKFNRIQNSKAIAKQWKHLIKRNVWLTKQANVRQL